MNIPNIGYATRQSASSTVNLAYRSITCSPTSGNVPTVVYLPGLLRTWGGLKAQVLEAECPRLGLNYLSLHYQGHGHGLSAADSTVVPSSSNKIEEIRSLEEWILDIETVLDSVIGTASSSGQHLILVGSSLGAWLGLHVNLRRRKVSF